MQLINDIVSLITNNLLCFYCGRFCWRSYWWIYSEIFRFYKCIHSFYNKYLPNRKLNVVNLRKMTSSTLRPKRIWEFRILNLIPKYLFIHVYTYICISRHVVGDISFRGHEYSVQIMYGNCYTHIIPIACPPMPLSVSASMM